MPHRCHRHPRGYVQAVTNKARPGAVPSHSYDDVNHCAEAWKSLKIARRLREKGWSEDRIQDHINKHYKKT